MHRPNPSFFSPKSWPPARQATRPFRRRAIWALLAAALIALVGPAYPSDRLSLDHLQSTRFFAADGQLLFERRAENGGYGQAADLDQLSPHLVNATLAGEDRYFYYHFGIDPLGILRAIGLNIKERRWAYGGSTITQQLAKLIAPQPRNLRGKLIEAVEALRLERTLTKREILTQYLNRAYYGRLAYGAEAAAQRFFGLSAEELSLGQAALLAVLPRGPSAYAPDRHLKRALRRRAHILGKMVERGFITESQAQAAKKEPLHFRQLATQLQARHAVDRLIQRRDLSGDVQTTLDLGLQQTLTQAVERHLTDIRSLGASQAGVVVLENQTGAILAMVGSRDYEGRKYLGANNAVLARRPAGSTLKPFIYALAIEQGRSARSLITDSPSEWIDYEPRNSHDRYHGPVPLADALGSSLNLPAVRLTAELGPAPVAQRLHQLGFAQVDPTGHRHGLAIALGGAPVNLLELAAAYAALSQGGIWKPASLTTDYGIGASVMSTLSAEQVAAMLTDPSYRRLEFGLETPLDLPFAVAAKTGTSSSFGDNWTIGFTSDVTVAVWVGNFDGRPLHGSLAMRGAAPLFQDAIMLAREAFGSGSHELGDGLESSEETIARAGTIATADSADGNAAEGNVRSETAPPRYPAAERLRITSPRPGSQLLLDPALPHETQRIALSATTPTELRDGSAVSRIRWLVNGKPALQAAPDEQHSWPLSAGQFRFVAHALDASGNTVLVSDPVVVVVEGEEHAQYL